jgi:hypothetical protein
MSRRRLRRRDSRKHDFPMFSTAMPSSQLKAQLS